MANNQNYYTNPAFCQKSEVVPLGHPPRALSPLASTRQSPLGAQTITHHQDIEASLEEQEFYEEVVVDDKGFITEKKFVVVAQNNEGKKYIQAPQTEQRLGARYGVVMQSQSINRVAAKAKEPRLTRSQSQRYEYIQMQEHDRTPRKKTQHDEDFEISPGRIHRYAVIDTEEEPQLASNHARYALVPVDQLKDVVAASKNRYEYIQEHQGPLSPSKRIPATPPNTKGYVQGSGRYSQAPVPTQSPTRYEYIQRQSPMRPEMPLGNPMATQKLHELLSTPKKSTPGQKPLLPGRKMSTPPVSPILKEFQVQKPRLQPSKAQQKLNYTLGAQQVVHQDKRYTAIVAPMCSNLNQSVYSETTYSKSGSWMDLNVKKGAVQRTLSFAALMMLLCGVVTSGLGFYMISRMGRQYFLDFGVVAGFTCLVLGLLGFRSRNVYWLPNRNYISGYLVLSFFSLLTCTGLLVLLVKQPRPGTPLADITSGAVCGISVLCLAMATTGVISSYCCKYPPPDNRVQHCAEGFSV